MHPLDIISYLDYSNKLSSKYYESLDGIDKLIYHANITGSSTYMTGDYCVNGHLSPRYVSSKYCVQCAKESRI